MTTRNPNLELPPDAASIIAEVNFTTTRAGLTGQVGSTASCTLIRRLSQRENFTELIVMSSGIFIILEIFHVLGYIYYSRNLSYTTTYNSV